MIEVNLWSGLRRFTGGQESVQIEASTIGEMLDALSREWPGLEPVLKNGVSVAVDGEIINGNRHKPLSSDNEIFLMQPLKGG